MKKIKIFLAKLLIYGMDNPSGSLPNWLGFLFILIFVGGGPIILGFLAKQLVFGILTALWFMYLFFSFSLRSQLEGARLALNKPPKIGKTKVDFRVDDVIIWESKEFIFNPENAEGVSVSVTNANPFGNKGGRHIGSLKGGENINNPDVLEWHREAKRILEEEGYKEFVQYCKKSGENESTVRTRLKLYKDLLT